MTRLSCMYARSHLSVGHGTHTHPLVLASRDLMKNHLTGSIPPEVLKMTWYGASIDIYSVLFMKDYTAMWESPTIIWQKGMIFLNSGRKIIRVRWCWPASNQTDHFRQENAFQTRRTPKMMTYYSSWNHSYNKPPAMWRTIFGAPKYYPQPSHVGKKACCSISSGGTGRMLGVFHESLAQVSLTLYSNTGTVCRSVSWARRESRIRHFSSSHWLF